MQNVMNVSYDTKIPNNVNLSSDRRVLKALEKWHPGYIDWWTRLIPQQFQNANVYLRTAIGVETRWLGQIRLCEDAGNIAGVSCWRRKSRTARLPLVNMLAKRPGRKCRANIAPCCAA